MWSRVCCQSHIVSLSFSVRRSFRFISVIHRRRARGWVSGRGGGLNLVPSRTLYSAVLPSLIFPSSSQAPILLVCRISRGITRHTRHARGWFNSAFKGSYALVRARARETVRLISGVPRLRFHVFPLRKRRRELSRVHRAPRSAIIYFERRSEGRRRNVRVTRGGGGVGETRR